MLYIIDPNTPDPRPAIELQEGRLVIRFHVEMAFYDALADNERTVEVLGDQQLSVIASEVL